MLRGRIAAAVAGFALASLAGPSTAGAAEKAIWGPITFPSGQSAFPTYRHLGVDTFQHTLNWAAIASERPADPGNPRDSAYRWPASLDGAVAAAAANRIDVALLVTRSPGWANGGRPAIHAPEPRAYAEFVAAASRRYPSVRRWMIWGEPNRADRFQPNTEGGPEGARAYAPILDAAYRSLKAVSRRNIVIGGMTWTGGDVKPAAFMNYMRLGNGRPPRLDWFGHNPYPFRFPDLRHPAVGGGYRDISDLDTFQRQLRRTYGRGARFWLSEFFMQSDRPSDTFRLAVSRTAQARWLAAAYGIADNLDSVAGLGWFSLLDQPERPGSSNWGLLTAAGQRKPAYAAYRRARSERYRPLVRGPRRIARPALARDGLRVRIRARARGRLSVSLERGGRRLVRAGRRVGGGRSHTIRLRKRRAPSGRCVLVVRAPRGSTVRRVVTIR